MSWLAPGPGHGVQRPRPTGIGLKAALGPRPSASRVCTSGTAQSCPQGALVTQRDTAPSWAASSEQAHAAAGAEVWGVRTRPHLAPGHAGTKPREGWAMPQGGDVACAAPSAPTPTLTGLPTSSGLWLAVGTSLWAPKPNKASF